MAKTSGGLRVSRVLKGRGYTITPAEVQALKSENINAWGTDAGLKDKFYTTKIDGLYVKQALEKPKTVNIEGYNLYLAKIDGRWHIIEPKSGAEMTDYYGFKTQREAIEDATLRTQLNIRKDRKITLPKLINSVVFQYTLQNKNTIQDKIKK